MFDYLAGDHFAVHGWGRRNVNEEVKHVVLSTMVSLPRNNIRGQCETVFASAAVLIHPEEGIGTLYFDLGTGHWCIRGADFVCVLPCSCYVGIIT